MQKVVLKKIVLALEAPPTRQRNFWIPVNQLGLVSITLFSKTSHKWSIKVLVKDVMGMCQSGLLL